MVHKENTEKTINNQLVKCKLKIKIYALKGKRTVINKYWLHYICVLFWFALKNMLNSGNTGCTSIPNSCNVHVTFDLGCVSLVVGVFTSQTKYMKKIYIRGGRRRGGGF